MASLLNPYLAFDGQANEAMEFYKDVFGGELNVHRFGDSGPQEGVNPDGVMHAQLQTKAGFTLMASDMPPGMPLQAGNNMSISLSGEDEAELRGYWDALSGSGTETVPLEKQVWGDTFGMCVDKFGVAWMVNIVQSQA